MIVRLYINRYIDKIKTKHPYINDTTQYSSMGFLIPDNQRENIPRHVEVSVEYEEGIVYPEVASECRW